MLLLSTLDFSLPLKNPVIIFSLVLFIILFAPILLSKIKVPHIIGLILAGVIIGPYGLNFLRRDASIVLFGTVGLLYIMFIAGLEIDMGEFKKNTKKIIFFGLATFLLPLGIGALASHYILGYSYMTSILLASMFSTHTLISYPIASRYGVAKNKAVMLTIGATILTDILALLILAVVAGVAKGDVSNGFWIQMGVSSIVFVLIVFLGFPIIVRWFFKHFEDSISQYIFVLAMVFLASFLAEAAGLEAIIGAFFSGLVLNKFVPESSPLMNRIGFVGNALFIPFFLIGVGMLVDVTVLVKGWGALRVAGVIVVVAVITKYLAAFITQKTLRLTKDEGLMIFGLSTSHAAATLAIILVGYNIIIGETALGEPIRLLNEDVLNGTILLILVSCAISSFAVERASRNLAKTSQSDRGEEAEQHDKVLISVAYADRVEELVDLGLMLKNTPKKFPVYALHVTDESNESINVASEGKKILDKVIKHGSASENTIVPISRFDSDVCKGIVYTVKEHGVTDILMGLTKSDEVGSFLGAKTENILKKSFETLYVYKAVQPLNTLKRMLVLMPENVEMEPGFVHWCYRLHHIAKELGGMTIAFYGFKNSLEELKVVRANMGEDIVPATFQFFNNWDDFLIFTREVKPNDLFVIISSRKQHPSYFNYLEKIPNYLNQYFTNNSFIILYPKQFDFGINMADIQQLDANFLENFDLTKGLTGRAIHLLKKWFTKKSEDKIHE